MRAVLALPLGLLTVVSLLATGAAFAEDPVPAGQPKKTVVVPNARCPVTGEPAQEETRVAWGDLEIRLCCPGCIDTFKKDPGAYAKVLLVDLTEQVLAGQKRIAELEAKCEEKDKRQKEKEKAEKAPAPPSDKPGSR